jgi:hypothetical protein
MVRSTFDACWNQEKSCVLLTLTAPSSVARRGADASSDAGSCKDPVNTSLILFVKMAAFAAVSGRGLTADVVILRVFSSSVA